MRLIIRVQQGYLKRINQQLFRMPMNRPHQIGYKAGGASYILIDGRDIETVRKCFDKFNLECKSRLLTK